MCAILNKVPLLKQHLSREIHKAWRTERRRFQVEGTLSAKAMWPRVCLELNTDLMSLVLLFTGCRLDSLLSSHTGVSCSSQACFQFREAKNCNFHLFIMLLPFSLLSNSLHSVQSLYEALRNIHCLLVEYELFRLLMNYLCCKALALSFPA